MKWWHQGSVSAVRPRSSSQRHRSGSAGRLLKSKTDRRPPWVLAVSKRLHGYRPCSYDPGVSGRDRSDQRLDADDVQDPCQIVDQTDRAISAATFGSVLVRKCVAPMWAFIVPNGCSTVSRRWRMASRFVSRRCCTASSGCSCSHLGIRRSGSVVHWDLSEQF